MKNKLGPWAAVAFLGILVAGCTSIRARDDMLRESRNWDIYPGVQRDVTEVGDAFSGTLRKPGWVNAVVAPILLIDLPLSATLDTAALPYDLYRVYLPKPAAKDR